VYTTPESIDWSERETGYTSLANYNTGIIFVIAFTLVKAFTKYRERNNGDLNSITNEKINHI
jgi:hypothetical protein